MSSPKRDSVDRDLESLSKQELVTYIHKLEANVRQLRSIIKKRQSTTTKDEQVEGESKAIKVRKPREFDFSRYCKRHIALKFLYLGWDYQGYVVQEDTDQTIEDHLFDALIKTRLIEDRATSNYHRCGRTDKGVSAFSQVISIDVRSKLTKGIGIIRSSDESLGTDELMAEGCDDDALEIDYCGILNKVLPDDIRCTSWAPVRPGFSARFDCKGRCYYYYFPASHLNIDKMKEAGQYLVGKHDFTNFCKKDKSRKDLSNVRTILDVKIFPASNQSDHHQSPYSMYIVQIAASGFLWHQIRCIMAILFLIGEGREQVDLIQSLLDVKSVTSKPQYMLASDLPLVLFITNWDPNDIGNWNHSETIKELVKHLQSLWTKQSVKCQMIRSMIDSLTMNNLPPDTKIIDQHNVLTSESPNKTYKPILERPRCGQLDEHIAS